MPTPALEEQATEIHQIDLQDLDAMLDKLIVSPTSTDKERASRVSRASRAEGATRSQQAAAKDPLASVDPMQWYNQAVRLLYRLVDESFVDRVQALLVERLSAAGITFYEWQPAREKSLSLEALRCQLDDMLRPFRQQDVDEPVGVVQRVRDLQRSIGTVKEGIRAVKLSPSGDGTLSASAVDYMNSLRRLSVSDLTMQQEEESQRYASDALQTLLIEQDWILRQLKRKIAQRIVQYEHYAAEIEARYATLTETQQREKEQCRQLLRRLVDKYQSTVAERDREQPAIDSLRHLLAADQDFDPDTIDALHNYIQHMEKKRSSRVAPSAWLGLVEKFQRCIDTLNQRWQEHYRHRMRDYAHLETEFAQSMDRLLGSAYNHWQVLSNAVVGDWTARENALRQAYESSLQHLLTQRHVALERLDNLQQRLSDPALQTFRQSYSMLNDLQERLQRLQSFRHAYQKVLLLRQSTP